MTAAKQRDGVPEDYPGRITRFPEGTGTLAVQFLGVQGHDPQLRSAFVGSVLELASADNGAARLERGETIDPAGVPTSVILAYWTDAQAARRWWQSDAVQTCWRALPCTGETGYFAERMQFPAERYNYAAGTEDRHGSAAVLPLCPCTTFGYWGAYRDRIPASAGDPFESPLGRVPRSGAADTRGRRLRVRVPDNLCYIREGQGWGNCEEEERRIWEQQMNPVIDVWVQRLADDPETTGCLMIRDCQELTAATGQALERRTQLAFLLSLGHIERAARTDPSHLAVHGTFVGMYTEPRFTPRMHVWVEVGILKQDDLESEYVNCHPGTGLLPYFESEPA
ncbi:MAG: phenylacetaldoxime dehydratase family protein [Gammaproteobacteria bacterium]